MRTGMLIAFLLGSCLLVTSRATVLEHILSKYDPDSPTSEWFSKTITSTQKSHGIQLDRVDLNHRRLGGRSKHYTNTEGRCKHVARRFVNSNYTKLGSCLAAISLVALAIASPFMGACFGTPTCQKTALYAFAGTGAFMTLFSAYTMMPFGLRFGAYSSNIGSPADSSVSGDINTLVPVNNRLDLPKPISSQPKFKKPIDWKKFWCLLGFIALLVGAAFSGLPMMGSTLTLSWQISFATLGLGLWIYAMFCNGNCFGKVEDINFNDFGNDAVDALDRSMNSQGMSKSLELPDPIAQWSRQNELPAIVSDQINHNKFDDKGEQDAQKILQASESGEFNLDP